MKILSLRYITLSFVLFATLFLSASFASAQQAPTQIKEAADRITDITPDITTKTTYLGLATPEEYTFLQNFLIEQELLTEKDKDTNTAVKTAIASYQKNKGLIVTESVNIATNRTIANEFLSTRGYNENYAGATIADLAKIYAGDYRPPTTTQPVIPTVPEAPKVKKENPYQKYGRSTTPGFEYMRRSGPKPDYRVGPMGRTHIQPIEGNTVDFTATIRNQGDLDATDPSQASGEIIGPNGYASSFTPRQTTALAQGTTEQLSFDGWTPPLPGAYTFEVCADSGNDISESNETNNCYAMSFTVIPSSNNPTGCTASSTPSITVVKPNGGETYVDGQDITVKWDSCNYTNAGVNIVIAYNDQNNNPQYITSSYSLTSGVLTPNDGAEVVTLPMINRSFGPAGNYYIMYVTDGGNPSFTPIKDGSDDFFAITSVTPPPRDWNNPDYMIRAVGYTTQGRPQAGKPTKIHGKVKNVSRRGDAVVWSKTSVAITGPNNYATTLPLQDTSPLPKRTIEREYWSGADGWTPPDAGVYTIEICADADNDITEIYESNNCMSKDITVQPAPVPRCSGNLPFESSPNSTGGPTDPHQICNCEQLQNMNTDLDGHFELISDIDCRFDTQDPGGLLYNGGAGFDPVGDGSGSGSPSTFRGDLDGAGYYISDLFINRPSEDAVGLFGVGTGFSIKDVGLDDMEIKGSNFVGGFVGFSLATSPSSLDNIYISGGSVDGQYDVGGVIGQNRQASISNANIRAQIAGTGNVGGIVGNADNASHISKSYMRGTITGSVAGGLVGLNNNASQIVNSYSVANRVDGQIAGGLIGINTSNSSVVNSYSAGPVVGSAIAGGLVGTNSGSSCVSSFWDTQTSYPTSAPGCGTGLPNNSNTTTINSPAFQTLSNWDFTPTGIWAMDPNINGGYPYLR